MYDDHDSSTLDGVARHLTPTTEDFISVELVDGPYGHGSLPECLQGILQLKEELLVTPPRLVRVGASTEKNSSYGSHSEKTNDSSVKQTRPLVDAAAHHNIPKKKPDYEIHHDIYNATSDAIAGRLNLVRSIQSRPRSWAETTAYLLQWHVEGCQGFLDAVIHDLACDFKADLITVDFEYLEDWCQNLVDADNFDRDDRDQSFVKKYVELRPAAQEDVTDSFQDVIKVLLSAAEERRKATGTLVSDLTPLIIHLRDVTSISGDCNGRPFLSQLHQAVRKEREAGKAVLILATAVSDSDRDSQDENMGYAYEDLNFGNGTLCNLPPVRSDKVKKTFERYARLNTMTFRLRQLRRVLRWTLEPEFKSDVFLPTARWELPDTDEVMSFVTDWGHEMDGKIVKQIYSRACANPKIKLDDVIEVIHRMARNKSLASDYMNEDSTLGEEGEGKDDTDQKEESGWQQLISRLNLNCSETEKNLMETVIDIEGLSADQHELWADEGVLAGLRQLLQLRQKKSYGILATESINGCILYGPPGVGKTHLARVMAKRSGMNLIVAGPAEIESKWTGETEQNIQALFSLGRKASPCIIFLDEADSMLGRRTANDRRWERKAMAQFLTEIEGLKRSEDQPFLVVATNRPFDLDEAINRRLPHALHICLPNVTDRKEILKIYLHREQVSECVDLWQMAEFDTDGFSGSDLRTLCIQAALAAERELDEVGSESADLKADEETRKRVLTKAHFEKALELTRPTVTKELLDGIAAFEASRK